MRVDSPTREQIPQLRSLWQEAFGDEEAFLDAFFDIGFSPDRSRCVITEDGVVAALYWFDCRWKDRKLAYLYAVATRKNFRGRGLCRQLMADTLQVLASQGYAGTLLVPGDQDLLRMYEGMGYSVCTQIREFVCQRGRNPVALRPVEPEEYARLRRRYLPENGVIQEEETLAFLASQCGLYAGENFLYAEDAELLGDSAAAPGILAALGKEKGRFRTPGEGKPFGMYCPITENLPLSYLGLALD